MNLLQFLQFYNSYNNIGGKFETHLNLFEIFKNDWIFHQNSIDQVLAFIRVSSLQETLELIDEEKCITVKANYKDICEQILKRTWLTLHLESVMEGLNEQNYNDPQFATLLFGEPSIGEVEEMTLSTEEDLDDVEDNDEEIEEDTYEENTDEEDSDDEDESEPDDEE